MSDDALIAERLTAARVLIHRDHGDDIILAMTGAMSGDHHFVVPRADFMRLVASLRDDAMKLSTMSQTGKLS